MRPSARRLVSQAADDGHCAHKRVRRMATGAAVVPERPASPPAGSPGFLVEGGTSRFSWRTPWVRDAFYGTTGSQTALAFPPARITVTLALR